ncbi:hypothetical protein N7676_08660 [Stenotrophomonas sp. GD03993]|uniref:hypothetical protein n=1 Tax=unclassified Stenotrophomonas TaxID=196198 RepID=UPI001311C63E|nr:MULTISPECIES: hypothetical protein [unclassified Stenotrophomonas]MDH0188152.1 hypothetical protein [Stenotrophomonas sp. GD04051]MDH0463877.1 hypothetical protein [Stenotrophomonas sp. GD03993]MDH0876714.1 hypothetical protein [Stenotrophomonas sp. GD03877]MDH2155654.1 hypothetical protein [Stenotrophomonas sp. GD03657]
MTTDKTLADVQPGGRVRLGDQAERARFEDWGLTEGLPLARGKFGGYAFEVTAKAWLAWQYLSAQPSPGGQGDALRVIAERLRGAGANLPAPPITGTIEGSMVTGLSIALALVEEALAARQPVGEPIGWYTEDHLTDRSATTYDRTVADRWRAKGWPVSPLYAAPAQAVDLGTGVKAIAAERERQLQAEGFTRDGDQQYRRGELAKAATAYVQLAAMDLEAGTRNHIAWRAPAAVWPWAPEWWKPVDARRDLVRAGALIAAQIDAIDSQAVGNG